MKDFKKGAARWPIETNGSFNSTLLKELKTKEPSDYRNYLPVDESAVRRLLDKVRRKIKKQNTTTRLCRKLYRCYFLRVYT